MVQLYSIVSSFTDSKNVFLKSANTSISKERVGEHIQHNKGLERIVTYSALNVTDNRCIYLWRVHVLLANII